MGMRLVCKRRAGLALVGLAMLMGVVLHLLLVPSLCLAAEGSVETDVPAAVVVTEPASIYLPAMAAGDVYQGEFNLTNYGLIRAEGLTFSRGGTGNWLPVPVGQEG
jgi:hypothetical protein